MLFVEEVEYLVRRGRVELDRGILGFRRIMGINPFRQYDPKSAGNAFSRTFVRNHCGETGFELVKLGEYRRLNRFAILNNFGSEVVSHRIRGGAIEYQGGRQPQPGRGIKPVTEF